MHIKALPRPATGRRILTILCLVLAGALAGCSIEGNITPETNDTLDGRVLDAAVNGKELRLADATDFSWDEAGFVTEGTPTSEIRTAFGEPISKEKRYTASPALFVFLKEGKVTKAVRITPDALLQPGVTQKVRTRCSSRSDGGPPGLSELARSAALRARRFISFP